LFPKTIDNAGVVKMVLASAVDAEGKAIFPRKWNHEFIDMLVVEKYKQNTPCFSGDVMTGLADWKKPRERTLFILCGAAGLRIGEALGIEIDKHIASDFSLLKIRQKARHCKIEERLKTQSALLDVDLHPAIANLTEGVRRRTQVRVPVLDPERQAYRVVQCHPPPSASGAGKTEIREPVHRKPQGWESRFSAIPKYVPAESHGVS
jgi:hypothetical protein